MPHFKDSKNKLHFLSEEDISAGGKAYLPIDCIEITEAEAKIIRDSEILEVDPVAEAKAYLFSTDWYVSRKIETGKNIPKEVLAKRADARKVLSK